MELDRWPSPIAVSYRQMLDCDHVQLQFRLLIKVFATALRYSSLILIADYLRLREDEAIRSDELDKLLLQEIERPSLGHWNNFLRDILAVFRGRTDHLAVPELFDFYYRDTGAAKLRQQGSVRLIDQLITLRNKYVHPDIYPKDDEARELYRTSKEQLDQLLEKLSFLQEYPLVRRWMEDGVEEECRGVPTHANRHTGRQPVVFSLRPRAGSGRADALELGVFAYYGVELENQPQEILLYETFMGKRIKYVLGNDYVILEGDEGDTSPRPAEALRLVVHALAAQLQLVDTKPVDDQVAILRNESAAGSIRWSTFHGLAKTASDHVFGRFLSENKFSFAYYVERERVGAEISSFLAGPERALTLVAESGLGKTNLLCSWEKRLVDRGDAVLFFYARDHDGSSLEQLILSRLRMDNVLFRESFSGGLSDLLALLGATEEVQTGGRRLVILFDAVNEAPNPAALFNELIAFVKNNECPFVKLISTIRTFVWDDLKDQHSFDRTLFRHSTPLGAVAGASVPCVELGPFSEQELKDAFGKYRKEFLLQTAFEELSVASRRMFSNPLLLRFAAEAYRGKTLPSTIFSNAVFAEYLKERVNPQDCFLMNYVTEAMWRLKRDHLFHGDVIDKSRSGALDGPPRLGGTDQESLAQKLMNHLFADPVYETTAVGVCENASCPDRGKELDRPASAEGDAAGPACCERCRSPLGSKTLDLRTSYVRLRSENILQEFPLGEDLALRFTYDRWFEYLVGRFVDDACLGGPAAFDVTAFRGVVGEVTSRHIFWGALANVVVAALRESRLDRAGWLRLVGVHATGPGRASTPALEAESLGVVAATKQILVSAIHGYAQERSDLARELLLAASEPGRSTRTSMSIALTSALRMTLESSARDSSAPEVEVFRRGLRDPGPLVRAEAARVVLALCHDKLEIVVQLTEGLERDIENAISLSSMPSLIRPARRTALMASADSFATMLLYLLGSYFSDEGLRRRLFGAGGRLLGKVTGSPLVAWVRGLAIRFVADKLSDLYWTKGALPCGYIEMHLSLLSDHQPVTDRIAELFSSPDLVLADQRDIFDLCQTENGLIIWYMYSLIPSFAQRPEQTDDVLELLRRVYEDGNEGARYVVITSLWILAAFSNLPTEKVDPIFHEYARRYFHEYGGWVTLRHRCERDDVVRRYLEETTPTGERVSYWASYVGGVLTCRYDNSLAYIYADYILKTQSVSRLDFIVDILETETWRGNVELLAYLVENLGVIGLRNPDAALLTLQVLIEKHIRYDEKVTFRGRETTLKDVVVVALTQIKSFFPGKVDCFVQGLEAADLARLKEVLVASPEPAMGSITAMFGDTVYQKSFLTYGSVREVFGRGIALAGRATSVNGLFRAFSGELLTWMMRVTK